jgi:hypothetical protein
MRLFLGFCMSFEVCLFGVFGGDFGNLSSCSGTNALGLVADGWRCNGACFWFHLACRLADLLDALAIATASCAGSPLVIQT